MPPLRNWLILVALAGVFPVGVVVVAVGPVPFVGDGLPSPPCPLDLVVVEDVGWRKNLPGTWVPGVGPGSWWVGTHGSTLGGCALGWAVVKGLEWVSGVGGDVRGNGSRGGSTASLEFHGESK